MAQCGQMLWLISRKIGQSREEITMDRMTHVCEVSGDRGKD